MKFLVALTSLVAYASAIKIGFLGDSGAQTSGSSGYFASAVFDMLNSQGVDLIVQNGDLDYDSDPVAWDRFISRYALNRGMEMLISSGNHEEQAFYGSPWYGSDGYKARLENRLSESALLNGNCRGEYGERYSCEIGDVLIIMIGWAQSDGASDVDASVDFMEDVFRTTNSKIKFCTWHRPEGKVNPGDTHTSNYQMHRMYEVCRRNGAIITSGHCHVYGRTKLISSFLPNGASPSSNPDPRISSLDSPNPQVSCGNTFSAVVGMAGFKFDDDGRYANRNYFRTKYTGDDVSGNRAGALICDIPENTSGDVVIPCEFRLSTGSVIESFEITVKEESFGNQCIGSNPTPAPVTGPQPTPFPTEPPACTGWFC